MRDHHIIEENEKMITISFLLKNSLQRIVVRKFTYIHVY